MTATQRGLNCQSENSNQVLNFHKLLQSSMISFSKANICMHAYIYICLWISLYEYVNIGLKTFNSLYYAHLYGCVSVYEYVKNCIVRVINIQMRISGKMLIKLFVFSLNIMIVLQFSCYCFKFFFLGYENSWNCIFIGRLCTYIFCLTFHVSVAFTRYRIYKISLIYFPNPKSTNQYQPGYI